MPIYPGSVPDNRSIWAAMRRGARKRCPSCGTGAIFRRFTDVNAHCAACGLALHHQRADDAPPYFTMLIVGHIVVAGVLALEEAFAPPTWIHAAVWGPVLLGLSLWMLPRIKGALVGVQWALRMHGFGGEDTSAPSSQPTPQA
jgi:uncharacterized protein (DUF983 family)